MTTVVTPILRPFNTAMVEMEAGVENAPAVIPHSTPHTIAVVTTVQVGDVHFVELPDNAVVGDLVELYSLRTSVSNGQLIVFPADGDTFGLSGATISGSEILLRKISATDWRVLIAK